MEGKKNYTRWIILILTACLCAAAGFFTGKNAGQSEAQKKQETLYELNRASIQKLGVEEGKTIYVIGHKSPDTDTVCSAIGYARLLTMLGFPAEARITMNVNNETAYVLKQAGVEVPPVLEDASGENIFLVDHSEYIQAAEGMQDAHIVGILDHHGIGSVTTGYQVVYEAKPIGATAAIVWLDYKNYGLEIDKPTAYCLLGALLSDTSNLTASTTTDADRAAVKELAEIAGVTDVAALHAEMHKQALSYDGFTDEEILFSDYKEYEISGYKLGIGQVNSIDEETSKDLAARMQKVLPQGIEERGMDMMFALICIRENNEKIDYVVPGNELSKEVMAAAFPDYDDYDGTSYIFRTGMGRKTIFVPGLTEYLSLHPHE